MIQHLFCNCALILGKMHKLAAIVWLALLLYCNVTGMPLLHVHVFECDFICNYGAVLVVRFVKRSHIQFHRIKTEEYVTTPTGRSTGNARENLNHRTSTLTYVLTWFSPLLIW